MLGSVGLLLVIDAPAIRLGCGLLLSCFLPGWVIMEQLSHSTSLSERLILGTGLSYALTIIGSLGLVYLTGQTGQEALLVGYSSLALILLGWTWPNRNREPKLAKDGSVVLLTLLVLSAYLCFYQLDYSDLRGDEAEVLFRASDLVLGQQDPLFSHTKGPAEILLVAVVGSLQGGFDELTARIPFAVVSWLTAWGVYFLGRAMFNQPIALMATAGWVINGWLVSHSRTAQYQMLLLGLLILGVWQYWLAMQPHRSQRSYLGSLLVATAMLAHYDGGMVALPILAYFGWQLWLAASRHAQPLFNQQTAPFMVSLLLLLVVVSSFYLPFLINNLTSSTHESHLARNFGNEQPYNNLEAFYINGLFYNSIYYIVGGGLLLSLGLVRVLAHINLKKNLVWLTIVDLLLILLAWPTILPNVYALLIYSALALTLLITPHLQQNLKLMILWLLLPLALYLFFVVRPGNHFYVVQPALMLLAGAIVWQFYQDLPHKIYLRRTVIPPTAGLLLILFLLSAYYQQLVFMRTDLQYMLTYPKHRSPLYWSDSRYPFDIRIGWGFPYRLGWQTVARLYDEGRLEGDWYGNDENNSIQWYTRNAYRNPCYPYNFFVTQQIGYKSPLLPLPETTIEQHYQLTDIIQVSQQEQLRLYKLNPLDTVAPPLQIHHEPRPNFNNTRRVEFNHPSPTIPLTPPIHFKAHPNMLQQLVDVYNDPNLPKINGQAVLLGYDIDTQWAEPSGMILLTLHWQAQGSIILPYKVFTHLVQTGTVLAQADHQPTCGQHPTYEWRSNETIIDRHAILLPADLPDGDYELRIGLYEHRTGLRMDRLDVASAPAGTDLMLTTVFIESSTILKIE